MKIHSIPRASVVLLLSIAFAPHVGCQGFYESRIAEKQEGLTFLTEQYREAAKAARLGDIPKLEKLIKKGLDVNHEGDEISFPWSKDTMTLLLWATIFNQPKSAEVLIKAGANPNKSTQRGITPLMMASSGSSDSLFDLLCNRYKADPAKISKMVVTRTALMAALQDGNRLGEKRFQRAKALISVGGDIDQDVDRGDTALTIFARHHQWTPVYWLLEQGANYEQRNRVNATVMCYLRMDLQVFPAGSPNEDPSRAKVLEWLLSRGVARSRMDPGLHPNSKCDD